MTGYFPSISFKKDPGAHQCEMVPRDITILSDEEFTRGEKKKSHPRFTVLLLPLLFVNQNVNTIEGRSS